MARVPVMESGGRQVRIRRGGQPTFQQQQRAGAFGEVQAEEAAQRAETISQAGEKAAGLAEEFAVAQGRLDKRNDIVTRTRAKNEATRRLGQAFLAERTQGDNFQSEEGMRRFRSEVQQIIQKIGRDFGANLRTDEARLQLQNDLEVVRGLFETQAINAGIEAGKAELTENIANITTQLAEEVSQNPAALDNALATIEQTIQTDLAGAVTPQEEQAQRAAAVSTVAIAAVDRFASAGDVVSAREVLANPVIRDNLNSDQFLRLNRKVLSVEGQNLENEAKARNVTSVLTTLDPGLEFTGQQRQQAAELADDLSLNPTPDEVLSAYRRVTGEEPTPDIRARATSAFETGIKTSFERNSRLGAFRDAEELAIKVLQGDATPAEKAELRALSSFLAQENPETGLRGELSAVVSTAIENMGIDPSKLGRAQPGTVEDIVREREAQAPESARTPGGFFFGGPLAGQSPRTDLPERQNQQAQQAADEAFRVVQPTIERIRENPTSSEATPEEMFLNLSKNSVRFFDLADKLTGPVGTISNLVGRNAVTGFLIENREELSQIRTEFEAFKEALVKSLNRTDRFSNAARESVFKRVLGNLKSDELLRDVESFQGAMIGLDNWLAIEEQRMRNALDRTGNRALSQEGREEARDRLEAVQFSRTVLGTPPTMGLQEGVTVMQDLIGRIRRGELVSGDKVVVDREIFTLTDENIDRLEAAAREQGVTVPEVEGPEVE